MGELVEVRIPEVPFSKEEVKAAIAELRKDPAWQHWESKKTVYYEYQTGVAEFYLMTGLTPSKIWEIHAEWLSKGGKENHPVADALGGGKDIQGTYVEYLLYIAEAWVLKKGEKTKKLIPYELGDTFESELKRLQDEGWEVIRRGIARSTSSKRHTGIRSLVSSKWSLKGAGLPVENIPGYRKVMTTKYKPTLEEIRRMCNVANTDQKWIILGAFQMAARPEELLKLRLTEDILTQIEEIESHRMGTEYHPDYPPIVTVWYTPSPKGKGGENLGMRVTAFGYDAYEAFLAYMKRHRLKVGDPLFIGHNRKPLNKRSFNEAFMYCAKVVGLDKKAAKLSMTLSIYGLRGAGISAWEMGADDKKVGDWVAGHVMQGVAPNYFAPGRVKMEYERSKYFLNPFLAERKEAQSVREELKNNSKEIEKIKALYERLEAKYETLKEENQRLKRQLHQNPAEAFQAVLNGDEIQQLKRENQELKERLAELTKLVQSLIASQGRAAPKQVAATN
jgi:hypothetical protein